MIRKATLKDFKSIYDIEKQFGEDAFSERSMKNLLSKTYVCIDKKIVGYFTIFKYKKTCRIYSIIVDKDHRGKGYSKIMHSKIVSLCKGMERIVLEVYKKNTNAIRLYESLGYEKISILEDYYGDRKDGIKYELRLK